MRPAKDPKCVLCGTVLGRVRFANQTNHKAWSLGNRPEPIKDQDSLVGVRLVSKIERDLIWDSFCCACADGGAGREEGESLRAGHERSRRRCYGDGDAQERIREALSLADGIDNWRSDRSAGQSPRPTKGQGRAQGQGQDAFTRVFTPLQHFPFCRSRKGSNI